MKFVYVGHSNIPEVFKLEGGSTPSSRTTCTCDHHARAAGAGRRHRQGQEHRSGEGRPRWRTSPFRASGRRDDPQDRPPAAAARCTSPPGRRADPKNRWNAEGTGFTWVQDKVFEPYVSSTPTSCQMKRRGADSSLTSDRPLRLGPPFRCRLEATVDFFSSPAQRPQLRAAAVHAQLGPHADLQHDGRAELRPRELLHARCLFRLLLAGASASGRRWCWRRCWWARMGRCSSARCCARCTSSATSPSCSSPSACLRDRARAGAADLGWPRR